MADNKQLEMLKNDVEAWNAWRSDNPGVEINLTEADLLSADLSHADLSHADLTETNLFDTNLREALFLGANLIGADLRWARTITVEQLIETKTLYQAKMDSAIKAEVMKIKPALFEEPFR